MAAHRPRWIRLITALWAVWFAAILAQPAPLAAYLMRAMMPAQGMSANGMSAGAMNAGAMNGQSAPSHGSDTHHRAPADPACAHLGACCCAPVLTTPLADPPRVAEAPTRIVRPSIPRNVSLAAPRAPDHARPFAIGPPSPVVAG